VFSVRYKLDLYKEVFQISAAIFLVLVQWTKTMRALYTSVCVRGRSGSLLWSPYCYHTWKEITFRKSIRMVLGLCTVIATFKFIQYTCKYFTTGDRNARLVLLNMMLPFSAQILARAYKASYDTSLYEVFALCRSTEHVFKMWPLFF
jgi:hypothetical protein